MIELPNFTWSEITRQWGGNYGKPIDEELHKNIYRVAKQLQVIRDYIELPIYITSSYRNEVFNEMCGGVKNSLHLQFKALDFYIKTYQMFDYIALGHALRTGLILPVAMLGGVGVYNSFIHIDSGRRRDWGLETNPNKKGGK